MASSRLGAMAGASDQRDFLRRIPLLEGLSDEDIEWVASFAVPEDLPIGGLLTTEGEPGDALYLVISGDLEVVKRSGSGDVPIARLGPGEIVGEMAVLESAAPDGLGPGDLTGARAVHPRAHAPRVAPHTSGRVDLDDPDRHGAAAEHPGDAA